MRTAKYLVAVAIFVLLGWTRAASAQELVVRTLEHGPWANAVAAMQANASAEGGLLHVVVERGAERAPCGRYFLVLDAPGQQAFAAGACDPETQATALRLIDRRALFELGGLVARPRTIQIAAFEVRQAIAAGRAAQPVSAEVRCALALRPYLHDLLSGARVRATPERFELRPIGDGADIHADREGWTVRSASVRFQYELVDRRTREVVLRETVAMRCERERAIAEPEPTLPRRMPSPSAPLTDLPIERTLGGDVSHHRGRCGGERAPEHVYTLRVDRPLWISLRVESHFDAAIYLRNARGDELDCTVVRGEPGQVRLPRAWAQLAPGTYTVIVDGAGDAPEDGWYRLAMDFVRLR